MFTQVKTDSEIEAMREGGKMLATVLHVLRGSVAPGISTKELADIAARELRALGGRPAFLGYQGFPDVLCVSLNDEVVHGIPRPDRRVQDGDIVSLDFGVLHRGLITDAAISLVTGQAELQLQELVQETEASLMAGIDAVKGGVKVGDVSAAVQRRLDRHHYGIVRDLVGHGVGHELHEDPNIPNYGHAGTGPVLKTGMTIAIEPMATLGRHEVFITDDGWTVRTRDGSWAAHFEHTVLVTDKGAEILTAL